MGDICVRRVGPDDWKVWRQARLAALADSPDVFPGELARAEQYDEAAWRDRLHPGYGAWVLAFAGPSADSEPIGQVGAWLPFGNSPTLVQTWVHPAWRGKRVGDALVAEVLAWTGEVGFDRIDLWVMETNLPARRLYQRHGFTATGEFVPCPDLPRVREERMVHRLTGRRSR